MHYSSSSSSCHHPSTPKEFKLTKISFYFVSTISTLLFRNSSCQLFPTTCYANARSLFIPSSYSPTHFSVLRNSSILVFSPAYPWHWHFHRLFFILLTLIYTSRFTFCQIPFFIALRLIATAHLRI